MIKPDENTLIRLENLARVGSYLFFLSDDNAYDSDYFLAKTSLSNFKNEIDKLILPDTLRQGLYNLIRYLEKKIDERNRDYHHS
ncbi:MAG: hypothetical protein NZZ41_06170 [Candidatus Dojkabacteria bacterium]|nr:hypothetical protein [Candidatus Dojkabacteria bacterium]